MTKDHKYALLGVVLGAAIGKALPDWNHTLDSHRQNPESPHARWSQYAWLIVIGIMLFLIVHPGEE